MPVLSNPGQTLNTAPAALLEFFEHEIFISQSDDISRVFEEDEEAMGALDPVELEAFTFQEDPFDVLEPLVFESVPMGQQQQCLPAKACSSSYQGESDSLVALLRNGRKLANSWKTGARDYGMPSPVKTLSSQMPQKRRDRRRANPTKKTALLPPDFQPSPYSILCGQGRENYNAIGNQRFRITVNMFLNEYANAKDNPTKKSVIVDQVMDIIYGCCPVGAFVTQREDGRWLSVDPRSAREKVGALFRDCLADHYKSSGKSKVARRRQAVIGASNK